MRYLLSTGVAVALTITACSGDDDTATESTTTTTTTVASGADCDMPEGEPCPSDEEGSVDRYADYTECIAADEVPNSECPDPGEQLAEEQPTDCDLAGRPTPDVVEQGQCGEELLALDVRSCPDGDLLWFTPAEDVTDQQYAGWGYESGTWQDGAPPADFGGCT